MSGGGGGGGLRQVGPVVVCDRVGTATRDYLVVGYSECIECGNRVLLGAESWKKVAFLDYLPWCFICANIALIEGRARREDRAGNVGDR